MTMTADHEPQGQRGPSWTPGLFARVVDDGFRGNVTHPAGESVECSHIHDSVAEAMRCTKVHALLLNAFAVAPAPRDDIPF